MKKKKVSVEKYNEILDNVIKISSVEETLSNMLNEASKYVITNKCRNCGKKRVIVGFGYCKQCAEKLKCK